MSFFASVSKLFPPPNYLRLPSVGIDISDTSLKYTKFLPESRSGLELVLERWGSLDIPEGVVSKGEVIDVKKLSEVLKEVKKKTNTPYVRLALPEEKAYIFEVEIDKNTPYKEIRGAIEFKLEENVPISPREALFDYHIFDDELEKGKMIVSVTVYAKETIEKYYDACREASLTPISFEVEAAALGRSVLPKGDQGTYLVVDFGATRTGVGIVHRGVLMYTSTIDIGGKELSTALRKQLGDKEESELTKIKNTQGLVKGGGDSQVYESLIPTISAIRDELSKRISYWNDKNIGNEDRFIEEVVLCGGSVNLRGLTDYFTESLGINTVRANVWQNAFSVQDKIPEIDKAHSYGYATAIGLGLTSFL